MKRLRGGEFNANAAEFGESVLYMKPDIVGKDKMDVRWEVGIWLGIREESGESEKRREYPPPNFRSLLLTYLIHKVSIKLF